MDGDDGKLRAVEAAGGLRPLARLLGLAAPPVWRWKRVPAERVLQVEKATGVPRHVLRPDLYPLRPSRRPSSRRGSSPGSA